MYKVFNNSLPNNLLVYFKKVYDCHQHNTRKNNVNFKRFSRTTLKATSLCMKAPQIWNELGTSVKLCNSVKEFKHKYKILLLTKCVETSQNESYVRISTAAENNDSD